MMKDYKYSIFTSVIEENINNGILKPGDKLPSIRKIKKDYGLSISSVQNGYDYLVFKGLVKSNPRSGYTVNLQTKKILRQPTSAASLIPRNSVFRENLNLTSYRKQNTEIASLNAAVPSDFLIPQNLILKTMQQIIREKGASLLRYYPSNGSPELRKMLSQRSALHGTSLLEDEILITDGALQALYIALAATTSPNDIIAVESPCIFSVLEVIANLRLRTIEIPVKNDSGFDTDVLKNACIQNTIKAIVVTPNFHNPTGILMTDDKKKEIYEIASFHQVPIIENDIYGDLYFNGSRPLNIKNFDNHGLVLTFSSFSKTIAPGIRLGWLSAGRYFEKAERIKFSLGRSVSPLNQEIILKLLSTSGYERHLRVFRHHLEVQAIKLVSQFNEYFPENSYTTVPKGGYSVWTQLSSETDMPLFYKICEQSGINFTPGTTFSYTDSYDHCFRAVFSQNITDEILNAIKKIGNSL